jgi:hypothetical protein
LLADLLRKPSDDLLPLALLAFNAKCPATRIAEFLAGCKVTPALRAALTLVTDDHASNRGFLNDVLQTTLGISPVDIGAASVELIGNYLERTRGMADLLPKQVFAIRLLAHFANPSAQRLLGTLLARRFWLLPTHPGQLRKAALETRASIASGKDPCRLLNLQ